MNKTSLRTKKVKVILALAAIAICTGIVGITSKAQTEKRSANIKSKGVFDYDNGTVVMDASDFIYLADEIDLLEETYKKETVNALSEMNTYFMLDNSTTHNPDESNLAPDSSSILPFRSIIDGILASQSIPEMTYHGMLPGDKNEVTGNISGATEENLSLGMAAWVDGELIVGNGGDNNSYYAAGYTDGLKKNPNAHVEYTYHTHVDGSGNPQSQTYESESSGGCFTEYIRKSDGSYTCQNGTFSYNGDYYTCKACGHTFQSNPGTCGRTVHRYKSYYTIGCGYNDSQPVSAYIVFQK